MVLEARCFGILEGSHYYSITKGASPAICQYPSSRTEFQVWLLLPRDSRPLPLISPSLCPCITETWQVVQTYYFTLQSIVKCHPAVNPIRQGSGATRQTASILRESSYENAILGIIQKLAPKNLPDGIRKHKCEGPPKTSCSNLAMNYHLPPI